MKISDCRNIKNLVKLVGRASTRDKMHEIKLQAAKCNLSPEHMSEFKWAVYERLKYFSEREEKQKIKRSKP